MMQSDELDALERSYAALSGLAFKQAFEKQLADGQSAVIANGGVILEVFPDGGRIAIASLLTKPRPVEVGARYVRRDVGR